MDKINAEYGKKAQYQYVCPSDLQYKVPMSCPKHPVVFQLVNVGLEQWSLRHHNCRMKRTNEMYPWSAETYNANIFIQQSGRAQMDL